MSTSSWVQLRASDAPAFVRDSLFSAARTLPVVAVTSSVATGRPWIDPEELAAELSGHAEVVMLETGEPTWALSAALPPRLDVYGGAARIWWPGLRAGSDPLDHLLLLIRDEREAKRALERIRCAILEGDAAAGRFGFWPSRREDPADVARARRPEESAAHRTVRDEPDPWQRIGDEYRVGEVVPGRVFRIEPRYVLVELLPGASVIVPLAEIDYTWVRNPAELLAVGERVNVELLTLDPPSRRGSASIKRALTATAREGISLEPHGAPYLAAEPAEESGAHLRRTLQHEREVSRQQRAELDAVVADRQLLAQQCEDLKQQSSSLRKELRSAQDRAEALEARIARDIDPVSSESAFLAAVRVEHAQRCDEDDRQIHPLSRMRVGRSFLERVRQLEGVELRKVIEVCAQVASGRAREIAGRAMHELTSGASGRPVVRATDQAKAWRCALQVGTPSARRLHWWSIPQKNGETIEFASVAVHDDFSIPS